MEERRWSEEEEAGREEEGGREKDSGKRAVKRFAELFVCSPSRSQSVVSAQAPQSEKHRKNSLATPLLAFFSSTVSASLFIRLLAAHQVFFAPWVSGCATVPARGVPPYRRDHVL